LLMFIVYEGVIDVLLYEKVPWFSSPNVQIILLALAGLTL